MPTFNNITIPLNGSRVFDIPTPPVNAVGGFIELDNTGWPAGTQVDLSAFLSYDGGLTFPDGVTSGGNTELTGHQGLPRETMPHLEVRFKRIADPTDPNNTLTVVPDALRLTAKANTRGITTNVTAGWLTG